MPFKRKVQQAGFKNIFGNNSTGYILLSDKTDGSCGRAIYIDANLAPKFRALIDESKTDHVLHQLEKLRSLAGTHTAYSSLKDAKKHKHTFDNRLTVSYSILMHGGEGFHSGVHITDINYGLFGEDNQPGLYRVKKKDDLWEIKKDQELDGPINTENAAINGMAEDLSEAAQRIMPPMVAWAAKQQEASETLTQEGYTLFYSPQSIKVDNEVWRTPEQKRTNQRVITDRLAAALLAAQQRGRPVRWTIHGNGCQVLHAALRKLQGKDLSQHQLLFMAPEGDMSQILHLAQGVKMRLHSKVMQYSDQELSRSRLGNQYAKSDKVADAIAKFPGHENRARSLKEDGSEASTAAVYSGFNAIGKAGLAIGGTSLVALASLSTPALVAAGLSAAFGVIGNPATLRTRMDGYRNTLVSALKIESPALNPHFHPHLSAADFNRQVRDQVGGLGKSYRLTFAELLKKLKGR